jgi:catechol 2,3-dioxygenase-like lactoylglutathione lyase family enzyme
MKLERLDHVAISVTDVRAAAAWYHDVLGLERVYEAEWGDYPAMMSAGSSGIALFPVQGNPKPPPGKDVLAMRHLAFMTDGPGLAQAEAELAARGIEFHGQHHGVSQSIYFNDPDGHEVELTTYDL